MQHRTVALVGNPNCGKTTLFNVLTGERRRVSNRAGVTVEKKESSFATDTGRISIVDLPGIYSLSPHAADDAETWHYLKETPPDLIINVLDETNLERHLILSIQLAALHIPMLLVLNMHDAAQKRGIFVDTKLLENAFSYPVIQISAAKKDGLDALFAALSRDIPVSPPPATVSNSVTYAHTLSMHIGARSASPSSKGRNIWRTLHGFSLDSILLHPIWGLPIFLCVLFFVFVLTFYMPGGMLGTAFSALINGPCTSLLHALLTSFAVPPFLVSLIIRGICPAIGSVAAFFPQIMILFFLLTLLEDCGYMARGVFLTDRIFASLGLCGNCFIPMVLGFGCSVPAVLSTRSLPSPHARRTAVAVVPFISCSARMPVYLMLCSLYFKEYTAIVIFSLYLIGILAAAISARLFTLKKPSQNFLTELPPYRIPSFAAVGGVLREKMRTFTHRTALVLLVAGIIIRLLSDFDFSLAPSENGGMLRQIGTFIAPIFAPLGFGDATAAAALLCGLLAKEAIVSTLSVAGISFSSPAAAYAFMVFVLLYTPCVATMAAIRQEMGSRRMTAWTLLYQFSLAYLISAALYHLFSWISSYL